MEGPHSLSSVTVVDHPFWARDLGNAKFSGTRETGLGSLDSDYLMFSMLAECHSFYSASARIPVPLDSLPTLAFLPLLSSRKQIPRPDKSPQVLVLVAVGLSQVYSVQVWTGAFVYSMGSYECP